MTFLPKSTWVLGRPPRPTPGKAAQPDAARSGAFEVFHPSLTLLCPNYYVGIQRFRAVSVQYHKSLGDSARRSSWDSSASAAGGSESLAEADGTRIENRIDFPPATNVISASQFQPGRVPLVPARSVCRQPPTASPRTTPAAGTRPRSPARPSGTGRHTHCRRQPARLPRAHARSRPLLEHPAG